MHVCVSVRTTRVLVVYARSNRAMPILDTNLSKEWSQGTRTRRNEGGEEGDCQKLCGLASRDYLQDARCEDHTD